MRRSKDPPPAWARGRSDRDERTLEVSWAPQEAVSPPPDRSLRRLPGLPAPPLDASQQRRERAAREHPTVAYEPTPLGVPAWTVLGPRGNRYRVLLPEAPSREGAQCSCPDFLTRGLGTCKHVEATLAYLARNPLGPRPQEEPPPPPVLWPVVEEAYEELLREEAPGPTGPDRAFERKWRSLGNRWLRDP